MLENLIDHGIEINFFWIIEARTLHFLPDFKYHIYKLLKISYSLSLSVSKRSTYKRSKRATF